MKIRTAIVTATLCLAHAHAAPILRITEVMSGGDTADWIEVTNYGDSAADITGWKFDDNSYAFGNAAALDGVTSVAPGESVVFIEGSSTTADTLKTNWNIPSVQVGYFSGSGVSLSSNGDGAILFNAGGTEVHRVSFGAATSGTSFYWSYDASGNLSTATTGTLTVSTLPGYVTWTNGSTTMKGTPGAAVTSAAANYLFWKGGAGTWLAAGGTDWTPLGGSAGGAWSSNATAVFNGASGMVNLAENIEAAALRFDVDGYALAACQISLVDGTVAVAAGNTTVSSVIAGAAGLIKTGAGRLILEGANLYSGFTSVVEGEIRLGSGGTLPAASPVTTARFATFDFNGTSATVGGLAGTGSIIGTAGNLTINITGNSTSRLDGFLSGSANVIIDAEGAGAQRFDSTGQTRADGAEKNYTGQTIVRRGVLEVDVTGTPTQTSGVVIEGNGTATGEVILTTDGGAYQFGGGTPALTLAGGILGNESREVVDFYNPLIVTGSTSTISSRGAGDGVSTFDGEFHVWLPIAGSGSLRKAGQGLLFLHEDNSSFNGPWSVENGTLEIQEAATSGTGDLSVLRVVTLDGENVGRLQGRGTVGGNVTVAGELDLLDTSGNLTVTGNLTIQNGGVLIFRPSAPLALTAGGAFIAEPGAVLEFAGTPAVGTHEVLTASGFSGLSGMTVAGLDGSGLAGTLSASGGKLLLTIAAAPAGPTFAAWAGGVGANSDSNGDGFTALAEYALGASSPAAGDVIPPTGAVGSGQLTLTAVVRTDDPALVVTGESSTTLAGWNSTDVSSEAAADQTGVPAGCQRRIYSTPLDPSKKFLRLKITLAP